MSETMLASDLYMDTLVSIELVKPPSSPAASELVRAAFGWFREVEATCSRFDPDSELSRLSATCGKRVAVSPILFQTLQFALAVAEASGGAFDPTVGRAMELAGFDRNYRSGEAASTHPDFPARASYRDVRLDHAAQAVTLTRPLVLDLGAVAKGFAIDLAASALDESTGYAINAGGDVLVHGAAPDGGPWRIGIRHPRQPETLLETLLVRDAAVCTSGDYERPRREGGGAHIIAFSSGPKPTIASTTVVAPTAMGADALSTAAFALGPDRALKLLTRQGVEGMLVSDALRTWETPGYGRYRE